MTSELPGEATLNQDKHRSSLLYLVVILSVLCLSLTGILVVTILRSSSTVHEKSTAPMHQITIHVEGEETKFGASLGDITHTPISSASVVVTSSSKKRHSGSTELPYTMTFNESTGSTILVGALAQGSFEKPGSISCNISIDGIPLDSQRADMGVTRGGGRSGVVKCQTTVP